MALSDDLLDDERASTSQHMKNGVAQTALLVVANCAGAGILSLPKAINGAGLWVGVALVVAAALLSTYTADILGRCYHIIEQREQEKTLQQLSSEDSSQYSILSDVEGAKIDDDQACSQPEDFLARSPYACIGKTSAGNVGAVAVTCAQVLTQFSVMVLFFLISGRNLSKLAPQCSSLFFSMVCVGALTPFMLLRPGHVWATAALAILASVILVVVIIILCATDAPHDPYTDPPTVSFDTIGTSFGVILFGFGGHAILPALQATMYQPTPQRFRQAVVGSFAVCTAMYLSTAIGSVLTLGGTVSGDVLTNFSGWVNDFGLVAVTAHLLFAAVTVHIPLGQIMDHYAAATDYSLKQIGLRVCTMGLVAIMIWLIGSHFFCVMGLVGGTCNNAMIFIFPPWFYLRLVDKTERTLPFVARMVCIMAIGSAGMVSALIGSAAGDC